MAVEPLPERVSQLIKEAKLELSPSFTKLVDETVSSIKKVIGKIPDDIQVSLSRRPYSLFFF